MEKKFRKKPVWARQLNKSLYEEIKNLNPVDVKFKTDHKTKITFQIETEKFIGVGKSICSVVEWEFNFKRGINMAAGRAVKALKNRYNSERIRTAFEEFPNTWTKSQMLRVKNSIATNGGRFMPFKSIIIPK